MPYLRVIAWLALSVGFAAVADAEPVRWDEADGGDGRYYEYVEEPLTWHQARAAAVQRTHHGVPGRLVVIHSQEQNDFVHSLMPEGGRRAWIGLNDIEVEGEFRWIDGTRAIYTNWSPGEPNNVGEEDCVEMLPNGLWNDKEGVPEEGSPQPQGYMVEYHSDHQLAQAQPDGCDDAAG